MCLLGLISQDQSPPPPPPACWTGLTVLLVDLDQGFVGLLCSGQIVLVLHEKKTTWVNLRGRAAGSHRSRCGFMTSRWSRSGPNG